MVTPRVPTVGEDWEAAVVFITLVLTVASLRSYVVPEGSALELILSAVGIGIVLAFWIRIYYRMRIGKSPW